MSFDEKLDLTVDVFSLKKYIYAITGTRYTSTTWYSSICLMMFVGLNLQANTQVTFFIFFIKKQ